MAEERRDDRPGRPEERPSETQSSPVVKKKPKKRGKGSMLFLLLLLIFGVGTGLHFSGTWDARPWFWSIVPRIPYLGQPLSRFFEIPEQYTLTVAARRAFELEEWQKRLDERERLLSTREYAVETASDDIGMRAERLTGLESSAQSNGTQDAADAMTAEEQKLVDQLVRTYQDMSPRNAAKILEEVREPVAVEILKKLPVDANASILAKMDAKKAARITEELMIRGQAAQ